MSDSPVSRADVEAAGERLRDVVHRTPLDTSRTFAERSAADAVGLKLENLQRTGSFKIRGAYNAMSRLCESERARGVVTASAGNHAQGVALAGDLLGIDATVVVPRGTPMAKIQATRGYGAEVVVQGENYEAAYDQARKRCEETGATFVHPFDDEAVIAGQGTIGLELEEQFPDLDAVIVAIGGGGLISGIGTALKAGDPSIRVVGAQPEGAAHAKPSFEQGAIHRLDSVDTLADGIADARLLETTFAVAREVVDDVVAVDDEAIAAAVTLLAERAKLVVESAGATPLAALLADETDFSGDRVAVVLSGGNVDLADHAELVRMGRFELGQLTSVRVALDSWPRQLSGVVDAVEATGATLEHVERARRAEADPPNRTAVALSVGGGDRGHLDGLLADLDDLDGVTVLESSFE